MRGIPKNENVRREMRRKHASRAHQCNFCGKVAYGNGGYGSHMRKEYLERMPEYKKNKAWTVKDLRREWFNREQSAIINHQSEIPNVP